MRRPTRRTVARALTTAASAFAILSRPPAATGATRATAYFAGGCYWGVEAVFRHVKGVSSAVSGFGVPVDARPAPASGRADYVETVRVEYDPAKISYATLLEIFVRVAHDPTERDRQGPDVGPEYRSVVFVADRDQRATVRAYLDSLDGVHAYAGKIVTELSALRRFREADATQQNWYATHQGDRYVQVNDVPKITALQRLYPALYRQ